MANRQRRSTSNVATNLALLVAIAAAGVSGAGFYLWWQARHAGEEAPAAALSRDQPRTSAATLQARKLLLDAAEKRLVPGEEDWRRARELYAQASAASDPAAEIGRTLCDGGLQFAAGEFDAAIATLRPVTRDAEGTLASITLGHAQLGAGHGMEAWGEFGVILNDRPGWLPAQVGQLQADLVMDDFKMRDCPLVARTIELVEPTTGLGAAHALCLENKKNAEADRWFKWAFEHGSRNRTVVARYVERILAEDEIESHRATFERVVAQSPDPLESRLTLAAALADRESFALAEEQCRRALALEPSNRDAILCYADVIYRSRDAEITLAALAPLLATRPDIHELWFYKGLALITIDEDEAYHAFLTACLKGYAPACEEGCRLLWDEREARDVECCYRISAGDRQRIVKELQSMMQARYKRQRSQLSRRYQSQARQQQLQYQRQRQEYQRQREAERARRQKEYERRRREYQSSTRRRY